MPYVRTVKTASGTTAVQIVYSSHRGARDNEHLGSAHDAAQVELLKAAARQRLAAGQGVLDPGLEARAPGGPLPITSSRMGHLVEALAHGYRVLGLDGATGGDEVFAQLVLGARPWEHVCVLRATGSDDRTGRQHGNHVAVLGAVFTIAGLGAVDARADESRQNPSITLWNVLWRILGYTKAVFPDDESVQAAELEIKSEDAESNTVLIDCDLFFDSYIKLPIFRPLSEDLPIQSTYLDLVALRSYNLISQVVVSATPGLDLDDLPTGEEFGELIQSISRYRLSDLVDALSWLFDSEVHFGVQSDGVVPALRHMTTIESLRDHLRSKAASSPWAPTRVGQLKQLLASEIELMADVSRSGYAVYESVDTMPSYAREEAILAEGINHALVPKTRILAAEHLSYIRNRMARASSEPTEEVNNYVEACRLSHFAFNSGGQARYAKYIAQNLLEIAACTDNFQVRLRAEMIWVDSYVTPFVLALVQEGGNTPFAEMGWTNAVYVPEDIAIDYKDIPPYRVEPGFIYTGSVASRLQQIPPGFSPDLWTAAALLAQHSKDVDGPYRSLEPNKQLALFEPADRPEDRFPMRGQHPIAWLYLLADMLLREHRTLRRPHAGLYSAYKHDLWYRQWLSEELKRVLQPPGAGQRQLLEPKFPLVAKHLLGVHEADSPLSGTAQVWSTLAARWTV